MVEHSYKLLMIFFYSRKKGIPKFRKSIELFNEKTNEIVRKIHFKQEKEFEKFIEDFNHMRYPGYAWRYVDNK